MTSPAESVGGDLANVDLGGGAAGVMAVYLVVLLALGWLGKVKRREESLRDFYLAGSGFGFVVLFLTLFATQYSGNTLLGFAGRSYRQGATYVVSVTFMVMVICVLAVYGPRLYRLAKRFGYITPADYVYHRFGSHRLRLLTVGLLCWGLANYILEQLVAMGHGVEAISGGRVPFMAGVVLLAVVMLTYETLGGMRSVAWTDVVQGVLLLGGCLAILYVLVSTRGGLAAVTEHVSAIAPEKVAPPDGLGLRVWFSNLILLGFGVAIYPHAIQRIFAARDLTSLRRSLALMAFMPLLTTLLAFLLGYVALSRFPGLDTLESDKVTVLVLAEMTRHAAWTYWLVVLVMAAVVAAIMSTADSALLSIGSMLTKDLYRAYVDRDADPHRLLVLGKVVSWLLMAVLIGMAWVSMRTESSIWFLIRLKLEFMVQLAPALLLGLYWRRLGERAVFVGMVLGTTVPLVVWLGAAFGWWPTRSPAGVSAGVWGLALNVGVCGVGTLWPGRARPGKSQGDSPCLDEGCR